MQFVFLIMRQMYIHNDEVNSHLATYLLVPRQVFVLRVMAGAGHNKAVFYSLVGVQLLQRNLCSKDDEIGGKKQ